MLADSIHDVAVVHGTRVFASARVGWPAPQDPAEAIDEAEHDLALLDGVLAQDPERSVGTARYEAGLSTSDLLRRADLAMYEGKYKGKGTVTTFAPKMQSDALEKSAIQENLSRAIDAGEIYPVFQPIVDAASGALVDVEGLLRWNHPDHGVLQPAEFLELALLLGQGLDDRATMGSGDA